MLAAITIRKAAEADASAIAAILHAMGELRTVIPGPVDATVETVRRNLAVVAASDSSAVFIAETGEEEVAGYCAVHWVPFLFFGGGEAYVTELFVRPQDAQRKVGTRLLDTAVAEARRRGCSRLTLLNGRDGEAYRRNFYAQRGWVERERMANFVFPLQGSKR
jgi:GNAT superfamily N-acetyltransferase